MKLHLQTHIAPTSLFCCHLTGDAGDVTVKTSPACLALASVGSATLSAGTSVFTRRWFTPIHQILNHTKDTIFNVHYSIIYTNVLYFWCFGVQYCLCISLLKNPWFPSPVIYIFILLFILSLYIGLYLAVETIVAMRAGALVRSVAVLTCAAIHAWFWIAFVDVMLAVVACEAS